MVLIIIFMYITFFAIAHSDGRFKIRKFDRRVLKRFIIYNFIFLIPFSILYITGYKVDSRVVGGWVVLALIIESIIS